MKWNWGTGIVISFIIFCGLIVSAVVIAVNQDFDLVSETYYQDELAYQEHIDQRSNLKSSGLSVALTQSDDHFLFEFPEQFENAAGQIKFYHPSRSIFDKAYAIELDEDLEQIIDKSELVKGRFKVQIQWTADGKSYFEEQEVFLR